MRVVARSAPAASPRSSNDLRPSGSSFLSPDGSNRRRLVPGGRSSRRPEPETVGWPMAKRQHTGAGLMASDKRVHVTLECTECKRRNYITKKSKVNDRERIEMKKYCRWDRRHTVHKETR